METMTDETRDISNEVINQISDNSKKWTDANHNPSGSHYTVGRNGYEAGATHQHPIAFEAGKKEGFNEGLAAALEFLRKDQNENYHAWVDGQLEYYKKELEGLKTDIKK